MENEDRFTRIENSIESLRLEIVKLQQICSRMDKHITFVEDTYETLKNTSEEEMWLKELENLEKHL